MTTALTTKEDILKGAGDKLAALLKEKADALPKGFNETRFLQNCLTVCNDVNNIEQCTPVSIARALIRGAFLDLDFFQKECYIIVYNNPSKGIKEANFQTDYKGEIKLAHKYCQRPLKDLYAKLVRKGDKFEAFIKEGKPIVNFEPLPFNDDEVIGAFAVATFENGSTLYEVMSKKELVKTRDDYAKKSTEGKFSPAWNKSEGEMFKKIPLRRVTKLIDKNFDNVEQAEAYEASTAIDVEAEEVQKLDVVVNPFDKDELLKADLRKKYPGDEEWQIEARLKELKEA